ncbi:hypothetical protein D3C85_1535490 [compost metagenome]
MFRWLVRGKLQRVKRVAGIHADRTLIGQQRTCLGRGGFAAQHQVGGTFVEDAGQPLFGRVWVERHIGRATFEDGKDADHCVQ